MTANSRQDILTESDRLDMLGEYDQAIQLLSDAITSNPHEAAYWIRKGRVLADRLGRAAEAIDDFERAMQLDASSAVPHQHLSLCYLLLGDRESASSHAEEAVALESKDALSHSCLAQCRLHSHRFHSAAKHFEMALELDPQSAHAWSGLGAAHRGVGSLEKAEQAYQRAVSIEPTANHYIQLAAIRIDSNKTTEALESLEAAQRFDLSEAQRTLIEGFSKIVKQQ